MSRAAPNAIRTSPSNEHNSHGGRGVVIHDGGKTAKQIKREIAEENAARRQQYDLSKQQRTAPSEHSSLYKDDLEVGYFVARGDGRSQEYLVDAPAPAHSARTTSSIPVASDVVTVTAGDSGQHRIDGGSDEVVLLSREMGSADYVYGSDRLSYDPYKPSSDSDPKDARSDNDSAAGYDPVDLAAEYVDIYAPTINKDTRVSENAPEIIMRSQNLTRDKNSNVVWDFFSRSTTDQSANFDLHETDKYSDVYRDMTQLSIPVEIMQRTAAGFLGGYIYALFRIRRGIGFARVYKTTPFSVWRQQQLIKWPLRFTALCAGWAIADAATRWLFGRRDWVSGGLSGFAAGAVAGYTGLGEFARRFPNPVSRCVCTGLIGAVVGSWMTQAAYQGFVLMREEERDRILTRMEHGRNISTFTQDTMRYWAASRAFPDRVYPQPGAEEDFEGFDLRLGVGGEDHDRVVSGAHVDGGSGDNGNDESAGAKGKTPRFVANNEKYAFAEADRDFMMDEMKQQAELDASLLAWAKSDETPQPEEPTRFVESVTGDYIKRMPVREATDEDEYADTPQHADSSQPHASSRARDSKYAVPPPLPGSLYPVNAAARSTPEGSLMKDVVRLMNYDGDNVTADSLAQSLPATDSRSLPTVPAVQARGAGNDVMGKILNLGVSMYQATGDWNEYNTGSTRGSGGDSSSGKTQGEPDGGDGSQWDEFAGERSVFGNGLLRGWSGWDGVLGLAGERTPGALPMGRLPRWGKISPPIPPPWKAQVHQLTGRFQKYFYSDHSAFESLDSELGLSPQTHWNSTPEMKADPSQTPQQHSDKVAQEYRWFRRSFRHNPNTFEGYNVVSPFAPGTTPSRDADDLDLGYMRGGVDGVLNFSGTSVLSQFQNIASPYAVSPPFPPNWPYAPPIGVLEDPHTH